MKDYKIVLKELYNGIHGRMLSKALSMSKSAERVDALQDLLRDSISKSTLGMFNGKMYYFSGAIYEELPFEVFGDIIYDLLKKCELPMGDFSRLESVVKVCRRRVCTKELRIDKEKVVFDNCVVDTRTREVFEFSPKHIQFVQLPYEYDALAGCVLWKKFLDRVLPSKVYQKILQEFLGSLFVSRKLVKMETMMILYGNGSNGKSVIFDTVVGILGKESVSSFGIDELTGKGQERKRNIASINGKRLNYSSESRHMTLKGDSGTLKALISGEPIEARPMYGDNFTVDEIPHIMVNANVLPNVDDWTYGMRRRICILPFTEQISKEEQNKELSRELRDEYSAIFNWILDGRDSFARNGYKLSESLELEDFMEDYEHSFNNVTRFMKEEGFAPCLRDKHDVTPVWMKATALYKKYKTWVALNFEILEPVRAFTSKLKDAGFKTRRVSTGTEFAVYGKDAINRMRIANKQREISLRREAFYEGIKGQIYKDDETRAMMEERAGSKVAVGDRELARYLNVTPPAIIKMLHTDKLLGTYFIHGETRVYSLDAIDKKVLPDMEERRRVELEKKIEERTTRIRLEDMEMNDII
jgi:P4 family phage/plasmid primase-like protien